MDWAAGAVQSEILAESTRVTFSVARGVHPGCFAFSMLDARLLLLMRSLEYLVETQIAQLQLPNPLVATAQILTLGDPRHLALTLFSQRKNDIVVSPHVQRMAQGFGKRHTHTHDRSRKIEENIKECQVKQKESD